MTDTTADKEVPRTLTVKDLHVPSLEELAKVLTQTLQTNYKQVEVTVVECPDLTGKPWSLAGKGLNGHSRILDIGGVKNMDFPINHVPLKFWDMADIAKRAELHTGFYLGAGAGHPSVIDAAICELMPNVNFGTNESKTKSAIVSPDGQCILKDYKSNLTACLCNLYGSDGLPGPVIQVHVKERTGKDNLVSCMRNGIAQHYGEKPVGLGGTFQLVNGTIKSHVMPCFPKEDLTNSERVNNWLKYFHVPAPITCLSVMVSQDLGLDLRLEHTHFFSERNDGGHYHYDISPSEVEYLGYFLPAEKLYRIDAAVLPPGFVPK
eukprot:TRINITY_DN3522_c0_g1_i1.p1 TRINITY_DN3522_c0_g1~~TRINITY_DN3522_c0_g1_i1.p1  ORF type:complete len:320 (-),score=68.50 TRINITY_DN3522_c0_g1_i1:72-1031(-)